MRSVVERRLDQECLRWACIDRITRWSVYRRMIVGVRVEMLAKWAVGPPRVPQRQRVRRLKSALSLLVAAMGALPPVDTAVPPVLDGVIATIVQTPSDLGPALSHLVDQAIDQLTLFGGDGSVVEARLEVLVVPLSTLLG